jgi:translation elongation factor P/translation initiation factor 5A
MEARAAEKQGVTSLYTVTTGKNAILQYHDVFRRLSDGKVFRVTSDGDDKQTPDRATFQFSQVTAEEWTLTT